MSNHEPIPLSLQPTVNNHGAFTEAQLDVGVDGDTSFIPSVWVYLALTDADHDAEEIRLTFAQAERLHDRLGLILGRSGTEVAA